MHRDPTAQTRNPTALIVACTLLGVAACGRENAATAVTAAPAESPPPRRPNVLMVVLDTTRADRCGYVNANATSTPSLDALAKSGAAFTNAWSPAGWTAPAHASLFTGLRPENHHMWMGDNFALAADQVTLAESLRQAGYRTGSFSCNPVISQAFGLIQGFETAELIAGAETALDNLSERAQKQAVTWIDDGVGPWFVFLNFMEPHLRYTPPWEFERRFVDPSTDANRLNAMRAFDHPAPIAHMLGIAPVSTSDLALLASLYDAEVATADEAVGHLVSSLQQRGTLDDTIVVVLSDHGENLGEHGLLEHRFSLHRTICHVPLVIRYPPRVEGGRVEARTVRLEDVLPTILELCELPARRECDGRTLTGDVGIRLSRAIQGPVLEDFQQSVASQLGGASLGRFAAGLRAVYNGRYHLIRHDDGREELYDLVDDPLEETDRSLALPAVAERLRMELPDNTE